LREISNDVFPVAGSQSDPDITGKVGNAIPHRIRKPRSNTRNNIGRGDREAMPNRARTLAAKAVAWAAKETRSWTFLNQTGCRNVAFTNRRHTLTL
jgi:hypothetical protein